MATSSVSSAFTRHGILKGSAIVITGKAIAYFLIVPFFSKFSLFAVEQEVIDKDVRLTVSNTESNDSKYITVSVEEGSKSLITKGSWSCVITLDEAASQVSDYNNLGKYIQSNLQIPGKDLNSQQKQNKEALVRACSRRRKEIKWENNEVTGASAISKKTNSDLKFTFSNDSSLDLLLVNSLYGVEEKVINEKVGFDVSESEGVKIIAISTKSDTSTWGKEESDANKYYWECKITKTEASTGSNEFTVDEVKKLLPSDENDSNKNNQKKHLVELCSKHRETSSKDKQVKASLNLPNDNNASNKWKEYLFGIKNT